MFTKKQAQTLVKSWAHDVLFNTEMDVSRFDKKDQATLLAVRSKVISQISTHGVKVTLGSDKQDWLTPPYFLDMVRRLGPIALDPSANWQSFVRAWLSCYGPENHIDGLSFRWFIPENTVCFVNPPYGRALTLWANKMATDGSTIISEGNAHLVALIPARTGTGYWEKYIWPFADAVCFWHGGTLYPSRMCFYGLDGRPSPQGATFDAAVIYFGKQRDRFKEIFESVGTVQLIN